MVMHLGPFIHNVSQITKIENIKLTQDKRIKIHSKNYVLITSYL